MNIKQAYDLAGKLIPAGRTKRTLRWDVWDSATPPSWLTVVSGTPVLTDMSTSRGSVGLTTGAVSSNFVQVKLAFDIQFLNFAGIDIGVEGLRFDVDSDTKYDFSLNCMNTGANQGMRAQHLVTAGGTMNSSILNVGGNDVTSQSYKLFGDLNGSRSKNIKLCVRPREWGGFFCAGDELMWETYNRLKWVSGGVGAPGFSFVTREAVAHTVSFSAIEITVWTD